MKLNEILDSVLYLFTFFILAVAVERLLSISTRVIIPLGAVSSAIITTLIIYFKIKKRKKYVKNKAEEQTYYKISDQLKVNSDEENEKFLIKLFSHKGAKKVENKILLGEYQLFYRFSFEKVSKDDLLSFYKHTTNSYKTLLICSQADDDAATLAERLNQRITVLDDKKLFLVMKEKNIFPKITISLANVKKRFSPAGFFYKKNSSRLLYIGLTMLVFSQFVFYPLYYVLVGAILTSIGIISKFFGKKNAS